MKKWTKRWLGLFSVILLLVSACQPTWMALASERTLQEAKAYPVIHKQVENLGLSLSERPAFDSETSDKGFQPLKSGHNVFDNLILSDYLDLMYGANSIFPLSTRFALAAISPIVQATAFAEFSRPYLKEEVRSEAVNQLYRLTKKKSFREGASLLSELLDDPETSPSLNEVDKMQFASWIALQNQFVPYTKQALDVSNYRLTIGSNGVDRIIEPIDATHHTMLVYLDTSINEYLPGNIKLPPTIGALKRIEFIPYTGPGPHVSLRLYYTAYDHRKERYEEYIVSGASIPLTTDIDTFWEEQMPTFASAFDLFLNYVPAQIGAVSPTDVDTVNKIGKQITAAMITERDQLLPQFPDTFTTNLFRIAAQANGQELVLNRDGEFVYRGTQQVVPLNQVTIGYNQETIYSLRKVQSFFGLFSTYYALADGLYDEERTDALPKTLNETTVQAIEEIGGNVLKNLPNYENTEMVIKQSESKFDPVDVLLVAMCLPWGEMRSLLKSVEAGETLAVIEVEEAQAKAVLATEEKAVLAGSPNKLLVEKLLTTKYFKTKNLTHLVREVKT